MAINYPLYVTIDSNIFDEAKYDFSDFGTLYLLEKYVKQGKIKVVLSSIVCNEVKKHLRNKAKDITSKLNNVHKEIRKMVHDSFIDSIGYSDCKEKHEIKLAQDKAEKCFEDYLKLLNPEFMFTTNVDSEKIFEDYFKYNPPFENNDRKRREFPDAFIAEQINRRFDANGEKVAIITKDKGFRNACSKNPYHLFFDSLGDLYDAINKQDKGYEEALKLVTDIKRIVICDKIREILLNDDNTISISGQTIDKDGAVEGNEYDENIVEKVTKVSVVLHNIDQVTDEKIIVTLNTTAEVTAYCAYSDYDNAVWDSEEKKYIYIDTVEIKEKHNAKFATRVEIDKKVDDIVVHTGLVLLGPSTRISQKYLSKDDYYDYMQEIEDLDREGSDLLPLRKYDSFLEKSLVDSQMKQDICELFERINCLSSKYEDAEAVYDELLETINKSPNTIIKKLVPLTEEVEGFPYIDNFECLTQDNIESVKKWVSDKFKEISKRVETDRLPDDISFGDSIAITDGSNEIYTLSIDGLEYLSPEAGQEEEIDIRLYCEGESSIGYIKVTEGYMNFDDDGCVSDALGDDIEYYYEEVLTLLNTIIDRFESKAEEELTLAYTLGDVIPTIN